LEQLNAARMSDRVATEPVRLHETVIHEAAFRTSLLRAVSWQCYSAKDKHSTATKKAAVGAKVGTD
jgi:hypothetical protein